MSELSSPEWESLGNSVRAVTRILENRSYAAGEVPVPVRVALEILSAEIQRWRGQETGGLVIVCRAHRRRCELEKPGEFGGARIRHFNPVTGYRGELCFSQRHLVRWEFDLDRVIVLDELVASYAVR